MDSFFNSSLAHTIAHRISLYAQDGMDVSIRDLNMSELDDTYIDDVWRYYQEHEADIFIDIYIQTERDYIAHKTNDDIIFRETEMFKTKVNLV